MTDYITKFNNIINRIHENFIINKAIRNIEDYLNNLSFISELSIINCKINKTKIGILWEDPNLDDVKYCPILKYGVGSLYNVLLDGYGDTVSFTITGKDLFMLNDIIIQYNKNLKS